MSLFRTWPAYAFSMLWLVLLFLMIAEWTSASESNAYIPMLIAAFFSIFFLVPRYLALKARHFLEGAATGILMSVSRVLLDSGSFGYNGPKFLFAASFYMLAYSVLIIMVIAILNGAIWTSRDKYLAAKKAKDAGTN
jgi:hypothetical protein